MRSSIVLGLVLAWLAMPGSGMADPAGQAKSNPIEVWNVWGPSWGKSGLSALSPGIETRIRPTPGDVSFSWGTDRTRCLVWRAYSAPDGFMNFYSEDVLPGVTKMVVEDAAGRWAGAAAYAHTYLHVAKSRDVAFVLETGQPVVVWLNGTRVPEQGDGQFPLRLDAGWNRLLVKVLSPSSVRGVQPVYPTVEQPGNWTLRAGISLPGGGPVPKLRVQCEDPERNSGAGESAVPLRYLTVLRGPGDRRPLFVKGEPTDLTLRIRATAGAYEHFPDNPHDAYEGEAWTYAAPPGPATTSADRSVSLDELQKAAARKVAVTLYDFDGNQVLAERFPLAFRESAKGDLVCTVSVYRGSLPVGHYSLTTDFIDADGRVQARDHEHMAAVVRGPVDVSRDATSRRLSCVGHWLATRPNAVEKLEWLHRVGVTQHQKLCQGWSVWGVKHDGEGNVTIGEAPVIDGLLDKAGELGIRVVGDLNFGYVRPDLKPGGGQAALTAEEQETNAQQARVEDLARGIRLVPYGARPLPPYGTPEFEKTLHDYAHAVVSRYKDRVKLWCGDNEVDNVSAPAVAAVYAHASRVIYKAVKEADPKAEFITASLVRRSGFTDELLRLGYAKFSDHVDVHAHPYRAPRLTDPVIGNTLQEGHGVLLPYLAEGTKNACSVYYGEVSSPLAHSVNGATGQAEGVLKQLAWTLKHPIVKSQAYLALYDNAACLGFCNLFGDPLPANNAINAASHFLDGRPLLDDLPGLPENVEQICVAGDGELQTLMLWSDQSQTVHIPCQGTEVHLIDLLGRPRIASVADGKVAVHVTPTPQLVRARFRGVGSTTEPSRKR